MHLRTSYLGECGLSAPKMRNALSSHIPIRQLLFVIEKKDLYEKYHRKMG
jgi:hypothetical protein